MNKKEWKIKGMLSMGEDITDELDDLREMYEKEIADREEMLDDVSGTMVHFMRQFVEAYESKRRLENKLDNLKCKMGDEDE